MHGVRVSKLLPRYVVRVMLLSSYWQRVDGRYYLEGRTTRSEFQGADGFLEETIRSRILASDGRAKYLLWIAIRLEIPVPDGCASRLRRSVIEYLLRMVMPHGSYCPLQNANYGWTPYPVPPILEYLLRTVVALYSMPLTIRPRIPAADCRASYHPLQNTYNAWSYLCYVPYAVRPRIPRTDSHVSYLMAHAMSLKINLGMVIPHTIRPRIPAMDGHAQYLL
jgi:hypothetical protein